MKGGHVTTAFQTPQARLWNQQTLINLLSFTRSEGRVFTAQEHDANLNGRVFGGQLLAQSLLAAQRCCPDKQPAIFRHVPLMQARERLFVASLNHNLWFHRPCRADEWLLFVCESPSLQASRALSHVRIFNEARQLLASVAQDCLISQRN